MRAPSGSSPPPPTYTSPNVASLQGAPGPGTWPGEWRSGRTLVSQLQCHLQALRPWAISASLPPFPNGKRGPTKLEVGRMSTPNFSSGPSALPPTYILLTLPAGSPLLLGPGCGCRHTRLRGLAVPASCPVPTPPQGPPHPSWTVAPNPSPLNPAGQKGEGQEKKIERFELDKVLRSHVVQPSPSSDAITPAWNSILHHCYPGEGVPICWVGKGKHVLGHPSQRKFPH